VGIFFEPRPVVGDAEPELVGAVTDAFAAEPLASYQAAYESASRRIDSLAVKFPLLEDAGIKGQYTDVLAHCQQAPRLARGLARRRAVRAVRQIGPADPSQQQFQVGRFVAAVVIFACVVGAALGADAAGLSGSSKALYGFAASIFGVIVGLLGGESSAKS
jgi:hypothetical protein